MKRWLDFYESGLLPALESAAGREGVVEVHLHLPANLEATLQPLLPWFEEAISDRATLLNLAVEAVRWQFIGASLPEAALVPVHATARIAINRETPEAPRLLLADTGEVYALSGGESLRLPEEGSCGGDTSWPGLHQAVEALRAASDSGRKLNPGTRICLYGVGIDVT